MFLVSLIITTQSLRAAYDPDATKVEFATIDTSARDTHRERDVPVRIYYPTTAKGRLPIIIFSHGLGGSREGYSYLGKYWAAHGYVAVHITHPGSDTEAVTQGGIINLKQNMQVIVTDPMIAVDRCRDVTFTIDQMIKADADDKSPLKGKLDLKNIGIAGHSFGGNTTMLIAGETTRSGRSFSDNRITCAIAMSPPIAVGKAKWDEVYSTVNIPLFVMTGTLDDSPIGETKAAQRRVPFDHVKNIPAYLITFAGGDHMLFSGRRPEGVKPADAHLHQLILEGSVAFWDAYLRGDEEAKKWLKEKYAAVVGNDGVFEQK